MIESTPSLLAAHLRRCADLENQIALLIARREGLDVDEDPRPRVAVAAFCGVMRVTGQLWGRGRESGVDSLRALTEAYLDQLGPALVEQLAYGIRRDGRVAARSRATPVTSPPGVPYASAARHDRLHNSRSPVAGCDLREALRAPERARDNHAA